MPISLSYPRTSLLVKSCECLFAMIGIMSVLLVLVEMALLPLLKNAVQAINRYEDYGVTGSLVVALLATVVYVWVWHRREQAGTLTLAQSGLRHAWLQGIIRYWLVFSICLYGFAKLFKTQFQTPTYRLDMPLGDVSGMGLTWYTMVTRTPWRLLLAWFRSAAPSCCSTAEPLCWV